MSVLSRLKSKPVKDAAVVVVSALGFGYVMNKYREKASVVGVPADLLAGVVLTGLSVTGLYHKAGKGKLGRLVSKSAPLATGVGIGGLASYLHTRGAQMGAQTSGVKRLLVKDADLAKVQKLAPGSVVLGAIPKAPHGDFLSSGQLANLAT